ncbi:MAG: dienelactone hydrolase family protein [Reyranella sp.]|uniref:dienelactone hydrolase family protein n=1 Tax=Reyranella sp. TaxID=1929291 RepID=UPI00121A6E39|nr:dienelactone hydrolase family protein [Reyranella sp.]TAJ38310.1 MAG: dienelactone hydrolase family protein [Reyranella sp.]
MGEDIRLKSAAGEIGAYLATPKGAAPNNTPKGGIVVIQEIFGVNHHIKAVTDFFASQGYLALAPRFFDHIKTGIELGYTPDTIAEGRGYVMQPGFTDKAVQDTEAAIQELKTRGARKVGVTGYCWGGTISWLAATRLKPDAVSGYYGGGIHGARTEKPTVPTQLHFGDKDMHIPMTHVNELRKLHPDVQIFDYPADHGFHCDERGSWDAAASKQAMARTLEFFGKHVG